MNRGRDKARGAMRPELGLLKVSELGLPKELQGWQFKFLNHGYPGSQ